MTTNAKLTIKKKKIFIKAANYIDEERERYSCYALRVILNSVIGSWLCEGDYREIMKFYTDLFNTAESIFEENLNTGKYSSFKNHYNDSMGRSIGNDLSDTEVKELKEIRVLALCFAQAVYDSEN